MAIAQLEKCRVTGPVLKPDGTPCYPATITFTLSRRDRDDGITIMPAPVAVDTDADGNIEVDLWPNAEGMAGTFYVASVVLGPAGRVRTTYPSFNLVVPIAEAANLSDITELVPPVSVDDARAAVILAQQAAADAQAVVAGAVAEITGAVQPVIDNIAAVITVADAIDDVGTVAEDIAAVRTVAARQAELVIVAGRDADIAAVAAHAEDIGTVADSIADVNLAADNMALIQSVPALAAQTAGDVLSTAANVVVTSDAKAEAIAEALKSKASADNAAQTKALIDAALAGVTNYNNTLAQLTGGAKLVASAADVVAVFVYDTTLDSDKGAWRLKTKHTSWFIEALNTATRGARQFFPKKALIVARAASVTIYDMDSKDCPMWMVINQTGSPTAAKNFWRASRSATSIAALNGRLFIGIDGATQLSNSGILWVDLLTDTLERKMDSLTDGGRSDVGAVVNRNAGTDILTNLPTTSIINRFVNAVAATVLPGTPPDRNRAGLPAPTVAVATAGGVSVIHWDGRVTNSLVTNSVGNVGFDASGNLYLFSTGWGFRGKATPAVYAVNNFNPTSLNYIAATGAGQNTPKFLGAPPYAGGTLEKASGSAAGLIIFADSPVVPSGGAAYVNSKYNTGTVLGGPFPGLSLAESTADVTSLVASSFVDDFSTYADTAALAAVWVPSNVNALVTLVSGAMRLENGTAASRYAERPFPTTPGMCYSMRGAVTGKAANSPTLIAAATAGGAALGTATFAAIGTSAASFVAIGTTTYVRVVTNSNTLADYVVIDDISVTLVASDRSAAGNNPVVVGTLSRQAVATGAELAAIRPTANSGLEVASSIFSAVGTGDFSLNFWIAGDTTGTTQYPLMIRNAADSANSMFIQRGTTSGTAALTVRVPGGFDLTTVTGFKDAVFRLVNIVRRSGQLELWVNGVREVAVANSGDLTSAFAPVAHLLKDNANAAAINCQVALFRISAMAPTPAQIRAMFADEAPLFQPGAKCLLTGSNNVQGVDFDAATGLLYAAKAAGGTDVFKGLQRVGTINVASEGAAMTSNNHRSVSAVNDNITIATAAEVYAKLPTIGLRELLGHNGGPPLYDRDVAEFEAVTTNATPTVGARFPLDKGERGLFSVYVTAWTYGDGAQYAAYVHEFEAYRPEEGNIALLGAVTTRVLTEATASMDSAIAANTTTQTIDNTVTGVALINLVWRSEWVRRA